MNSLISVTCIQTERLILRQWQLRDHYAFAEMNADAEVMHFFPRTLSNAESTALVEQLKAEITHQGWGIWAVALRDTQQFIGCVGLHKTSDQLPFPVNVEVLWRLAKPYWGYGYATEAARAALTFGFEQLALSEIIAFTALVNQPSKAVMERLGMQRDVATFEHPSLAVRHPLRTHCLYRLTKAQWKNTQHQTRSNQIV